MMRAPFRSSRPVLLLFLGLSLALVHGRDENINKAVEFRRRARPSRYLQPWQVVPRLHLPSLECARHRVLYSPLRVLGSDGLGHGMATKNSEITTAIRLGVAYTHRAPKFGSLSLRNDQVMEDFFGWGRGEMSGERFHAENCEPTPAPREGEGIDAGTRDCNICSSIKESTALGMERLVEVPEDLSFRQFHDTDAQVRELVMQNNGSHTVFQMGRRRCGSYPILVDFSRSRPWFYHKYWAQHAVAEDDFKTQSYALYGAPNAAPQDEGGPVSASLADNPLQFNDHELTIAVHVRRGDFFKATNRKMINDTTYVSIIRNVQDLVEEAGGPFAAMPTAVYIYSEGRPKVGKTFLTHIRTALTSEYLDVNGVVQDAKWWQSLIRQARPQERGRPVTRRDKTPKVPRVELRISRPTIETIHQMNHADIFIGSLSGLSTYTVRTLSRAVQVFPGISAAALRGLCCSVGARVDTGAFNRELFLAQWDRYRLANERYVTPQPRSLTQPHPDAHIKLIALKAAQARAKMQAAERSVDGPDSNDAQDI